MPIVHPRETWFITSTGSVANTSDGKLNLYMSPVPLLSPGQSVDLLVYVTPEIVNASATYRNLFNEGAFTTEGYLHTHDDKSSITHTHTGLNILTGGPFSSANSLHTHDGFTTVSEVNNLIIDSLNGEIDFSFYVRKDGSINQLSDIVSDGDAIENAVSKVHDQNHTLLEHLDDVPVTTANLIKLMDGSNADCCHTHSFQVVITEHNELDDLQGGGTNEYYHLIEEKYSLVNRLDEDSSGLTFDGVSLLDTLWKRSGTTLTPINSGDDVLLNGDLTAANITGTILTSYQPNIIHNTIADLQGGDTGEYYHLSSEKYSLVNRLDEDSSGLIFDGISLLDTLWTRSGNTLTPINSSDNVYLNGNLTATDLGTFGNLQVDNININAAIISSNTGAISFSNENLTTTGSGTFGLINVDNILLNGYSISSNSYLNIIAGGEMTIESADDINIDSDEDIYLSAGTVTVSSTFQIGSTTLTEAQLISLIALI